MRFTRITVNPEQMGGVPCIRGLRVPVATVVGMVAEGMSEADILKAFPDLERGDIQESIKQSSFGQSQKSASSSRRTPISAQCSRLEARKNRRLSYSEEAPSGALKNN